MKTLRLKSQVLISTLMLLILGFTSCEEEDVKDNENPMNNSKTIVDVAAGNSSFSILVDALSKASLVEALDGDNEFTVFAPTNEAFQNLLNDLGISSLNDIPVDDLKAILLYHVISGKNISSDLNTGYYSSVSENEKGYGYSMYFSKEALMINGIVNITQADVMADNGVIHVIDKVMLPQSITEFAVANPGLSSLTAAVVKAELANILDDDTNNYTVFAPVNDAFEELLNDLSTTLDDLSKDDLTPILLYHVINDFVAAEDVTTGYFNTLSIANNNYVSVKIDVSTSGVFLNNSSEVVLTDVVATNGVIHVIDKVILPNNVVDIAINNSDFSILVDAVVKAELAETLSGEGSFTIFAPTNSAFETLFNELNISGISELTKEDLTPILLAHVVSGNFKSTDLSNGSIQTLNAQKSISIDLTSGVIIDGGISVIAADIQGSNGIVHVIDKVINP